MPPTTLVFRWDLDKTYLKSESETLREMMRIPFEKAEDKVAAPGVAALMRGLRESALSRGRSLRVYFISASPPQIGRAIRRKLELDGIVYDGIVFKDQLHRLMRGKFRHLREHIGYKLTELLKARSTEPPGTASICSATTGNRTRSSIRCTPMSPPCGRPGRAGGVVARDAGRCASHRASARAGGRARPNATPCGASSSTSNGRRRPRSCAGTDRGWCRRSTTCRPRRASTMTTCSARRA
jgi:hypothetical protein